MSFQNQGIWMTKAAASVNDGEVHYDNSSRAELKRSQQWFTNGAEAALFSNKKQAVGVPTNNLFTGLAISNVFPWGNTSSFQSNSGPFSERLLNSETARAANFDNRSIFSVSLGKGNLGRKVDEGPFVSDSSFGWIRKVKVSQVKESQNILDGSIEHDYNGVDHNDTMPISHTYEKTEDCTISAGFAYKKEEGNIMSIGETYDQKSNIFTSMGQPYNKGDDSLSKGQTYRDNNNAVVMDHAFIKGENNNFPMPLNYISSFSTGQSYNKGESTIISFSGCNHDGTNVSGRLISDYDMLMAQSSHQSSEVINDKGVVKSNSGALVSVPVSSENASKKKEDLKMSKKAPPSNNFPSNVRILLSTGMLDGIHVQYIARSREKELNGVIQGSGYLCGCQTCNFSKVVNAYEFERHANCKTKHPNNHIYFENGKTIYSVVQELRSTPQNMLFEVIQTITGSPINQKSFHLWKESFLAASRELHRIYGKDERNPVL